MIRCYLRDDGLGAVGIYDVSALVIDTPTKRVWPAGAHSVPDYYNDSEITVAKFLELASDCMPASVEAKEMLDRTRNWAASERICAHNGEVEHNFDDAWDSAQKDEDDAKLFLQNLVNAKQHGLSLEFTQFFLSDYKTHGDVGKAVAHANREWDLA